METVLEKVRPVDSVQEWWQESSTTVLRLGQEALNITAGRRSLGDNEQWCCNYKVQEAIKGKKQAMKMCETLGRQR